MLSIERKRARARTHAHRHKRWYAEVDPQIIRACVETDIPLKTQGHKYPKNMLRNHYLEFVVQLGPFRLI